MNKFLLAFLLVFSFRSQARESQQASLLTEKIRVLQEQILEQQRKSGEWVGINEGDPRWDIFFMGYSHALYQSGAAFMTKERLEKIISETIYRLKTFRGYREDGWALGEGLPISRELTATVIWAFQQMDSKFPVKYFPTQLASFREKKLGPKDMSVLDRSLFKMMGMRGDILFPFNISPLMYALTKKSPLSMAKLGYYRWGFIALTTWKHYNTFHKFRNQAPAIDKVTLDRKGYYIENPGKAPLPYRNQNSNASSGSGKSEALNFWAQEGLAWLMARPHADGNPAPTLIVQMSLLAAHRAGALELSAELKSGWEYMQSLRFPLQNKALVFQPSISPIWDTARVLSALAHIPESHRLVGADKTSSATAQAVEFLLSQQETEGGDYLMANPNFQAGGWGFAYDSKKYPDSDDTAMVVDALIPYALDNKNVKSALQKGVGWLIQMQNPDGGFPAWDFDATPLIEFLIKHTSVLPHTSLEPQTDVTARVLRSLKHVQDSGLVQIPESIISRGCQFLQGRAKDTPAGLSMWTGTWAINYIYGTSEALSTLLTLDCVQGINVPSYVEWLQKVQNKDGGWGESLLSYTEKNYVPASSTITQTLGALQLLLSYQLYRTENNLRHWPDMMSTIEKGLHFYLPLVNSRGGILDEQEGSLTACYACPQLLVRYGLIPLYMGTEVLGKYLQLQVINKQKGNP